MARSKRIGRGEEGEGGVRERGRKSKESEKGRKGERHGGTYGGMEGGR